ncbi:MAG: PHA/PHB synthase family protein [Pseudomonadota bacterium]|uniref:PHA/PHB synthase family protein n=1 Tax=Roseovarius TaxID=74030 RepID=UPI0022A875DC|nr:alpha/beta fold hydrolase [Roseovarius sp. EGI FJ00037]MCZ0813077.1 alpha/beta fold hydrolase [Roseovarius sp. EGI FJ00037]
MPDTRTQTRRKTKEHRKSADSAEAESQATPDEQAEARGELAPEPPEIVHHSPFELPDRYSTKSLDRAANAHLARFTLGVTPYGMASTFFTWGVHLMGAPGKQVQLAEKAARKAMRFGVYMNQLARDPNTPGCIEPLPHDHRFDHESWQRWPYNLIHQSFLLTQQWWYNAACDIDGVTEREEHVVSFVTRQMLDMVSPSNFIPTNPKVASATLDEGGGNLMRGMQNFLEDWERAVSGKPSVGAEEFVPGRDVATTPGKVVFRNHLLELIQYAPQTDKVKAEPILIVPAWIMKYYILDLSPHNSLVGHLVEQGYTVFMVSWRNPTAEDRDMGMADYFDAIEEAFGAVGAIVPEQKVHAMGYCLGGTLIAAKAAQMARDGQDRLASLSLLATQVDFTEPGELQLFISESEVTFLENMMWDQGYLDTKQMAGAFQLLRSADLIWSRYTHDYLMGKRQDMFDLMAWNDDATRLPYRMHSEYLRKLYLGNELAQGQYHIGDKPVTLDAIKVPLFCVSTTSDHIAPWQSVYKLHLLTEPSLTFVLTSGGHNAGIVSEPGHKGRAFHIHTTEKDDPYIPPETWETVAEPREGSWWPALVDWLNERSSGETAPPKLGAGNGTYQPLEDAPGTYVFQT